MGGYQVPGEGTGDDGFEEEGYDESQRAEILEVTRDGPTDGTILTDLMPDIGDDEDDDDLEMSSDEIGEDDDEDVSDEDDDDEDDLQEDFDNGALDEDDELTDADDAALKP
ncbi:DNA primase [Sphingomonas alpina]|uniref:DNA primase n=1 Tax=Sphingomonas alpina TaxID=653931 RepID=A0A7H0LQU9_9SPHN|nr:DNA primase [Sphingomonas alpina]QNQ12052.1 DNA primase [Sphingomonas alpina]